MIAFLFPRGSRSILFLAGLVVLAGSGCSLARRATGPEWSERREPLTATFEVDDHRGKSELRILVFGDGGTGKKDQWRVAAGMADECGKRGGCDFALLLGDNIYPVGVNPARSTAEGREFDVRFRTKFEAPYASLGRLDMWLVPGNHDWYTRHSVDTEVQYTASSRRWRMPAHDYEVPRLPGWLHIYGLATTPLDHGRVNGQVGRARRALCGRDGWRMLFGHHPVYSSGDHSTERGINETVEEQLLDPLIAECDVQLYLSGHDHHQEHLRAPLFDQIVQGAAAKLRRPGLIRDRPSHVRQVGDAVDRFGFALLEATAETLTVRFFACDTDEPCTEFHCQDYVRSAFADPERRSEACDY